MTNLSTMLAIFVCSALLTLALEGNAMFLPRLAVPYNTKEKIIMDPKKRPFCNAFTDYEKFEDAYFGCGKKRSNLPALTEDGEEIEDSINSLLELSAEPAIEDLSRQIMSEAKLWEAIQEANVELNRRKHRTSAKAAAEDAAIPARAATASCAVPPCYI